MSMPEIPEHPGFSREEAINQIIASIAMEELGLSHIINAEGEKVQFSLGTLPGSTAQTIEDILATNESINDVLSKVSLNQSLLRAKLAKALALAVLRGPTGPTGAPGPAGPAGARGGSVIGPTGEEGPIGPTGATGALGPTGEQGAAGKTGPEGPKGGVGDTGPVGEAGDTGPQGDPGDVGPEGFQGRKGLTGAMGAAGGPGAGLHVTSYANYTNISDVVLGFTTAQRSIDVLTAQIYQTSDISHTATSITFSTGGVYLIGFSMSLHAGTAGRVPTIYLARNGSLPENTLPGLSVSVQLQPVGQSLTLAATAIVNIAAGDSVTVCGLIDSSANVTFNAGEVSVFALKLMDA